jgi:hypothetical protein
MNMVKTTSLEQRINKINNNAFSIATKDYWIGCEYYDINDYNNALKFFMGRDENILPVAEAMFMIGEMYNNGFGVEKDINKACKWYRSSFLIEDTNLECNLDVYDSSLNDIKNLRKYAFETTN